jgi:hypothetical protein
MSKKWWSCDVVEALFQVHLAYTNEFIGGQQPAGWFLDKALVHKSKFEMDQKNRLENLAHKHKAEEDEQRDAAKHRQAVVCPS